MQSESKFYRIQAKSGEQCYFMAPSSINRSLSELLTEFEGSGKPKNYFAFVNWLLYNKGLVPVITSGEEIELNSEVKLPF